MAPAGSIPSRLILASSSLTMIKISWYLACIISASCFLETVCVSILLKSERSIVSRSLTSSGTQEPYSILIFSAVSIEVRRPIAISLVTFSPPTGRTAVCKVVPSSKTEIEVPPHPTSITTTPSSFWRFDKTDSDAARPAGIISSISTPDWCTHFSMFLTAGASPVIRCASTSSLIPVIPTGYLIPFCSSTVKAFGITRKILLLLGIETAWAASRTRSTSSSEISFPE